MNIKKMVESVKGFFNKSADEKAKETHFVQRKSKMSGSIFLQTLVFGFLDNARSSLNDLVEFCHTHFEVDISAQGLNERINNYNLKFLGEMFRLALTIFRQAIKLPLKILTQFTAVNITDSTGISLPESLSEEFPGSGGAASSAALKIQLVMDFLTGSFKKVTLTDGITPDQKYKGHIDVAEKNSLNIFDLGYFAISYLKALADKGAYFLCRLLTTTNLYYEDGSKVNLLSLLRSERRDRFELVLCIGQKIMLSCRVCFFRAPEEVANRRRQKAREEARKKGRNVSKNSLELMDWTILLTNVPSCMLLLDQVALLYSVRWQIELIFKLWKSHMKLYIISGYRKERILVELYAKLIGLVLFQFLTMPLWSKDINLSPTKAFKRFVKKIRVMAIAIGSLRKLKKVVDQIHSAILRFAKREKRKSRLTTCQQLFLEADYYA